MKNSCLPFKFNISKAERYLQFFVKTSRPSSSISFSKNITLILDKSISLTFLEIRKYLDNTNIPGYFSEQSTF